MRATRAEIRTREPNHSNPNSTRAHVLKDSSTDFCINWTSRYRTEPPSASTQAIVGTWKHSSQIKSSGSNSASCPTVFPRKSDAVYPRPGLVAYNALMDISEDTTSDALFAAALEDNLLPNLVRPEGLPLGRTLVDFL